MGWRMLAVAACMAAVACAHPATPAQPSPVSVQGTWQGTFRVARAEPSNCGNILGCPSPGVMTLTLERSGDQLSGILQVGAANPGERGRFAVKGQVTGGTLITLSSEAVPVEISCTGRPTALGERRLLSWSSQVASSSMTGSFNSQDFQVFNVGGTNLCPSGTVTVFGEDVRLTRVSGS